MGLSIPQLLIIFAIVILMFGTKKLRNIGADLGGGISAFKKSLKDSPDDNKAQDIETKKESDH